MLKPVSLFKHTLSYTNLFGYSLSSKFILPIKPIKQMVVSLQFSLILFKKKEKLESWQLKLQLRLITIMHEYNKTHLP